MSLWHRIKHPCVWFTEQDVPRLKRNAETEFWKPKFEQWRTELSGKERLTVSTPVIDFHIGSNTEALKAGLCYVVDNDPRYARLVASFLRHVVAYYRDHGPKWRRRMAGWSEWGWNGAHGSWGGLSNNFIVDPMMWFSCAHLYDLIYGKGCLSSEDSRDFEEMMGLFHRLCCLHEDIIKLDNNRGGILNGGSYLSTLFDEDETRADFCRQRAEQTMALLMSRFLDDGIYYEINSYTWGTVAVLELSARLMRNVEGVDFFKPCPGVAGFEAAFNAWAGTLIPGPALRRPRLDWINHWDSVGAGYLEYHRPELGWALSRLGEREWVPNFLHWPQGSEFYTYSVPDNPRPPENLDSHFRSAGFAILRSSWDNDARSLYFRYGFQGSSHGGGLDKLNFEIYCNDEALLVSDSKLERSHYKNVVLVDHQNQEQCSGTLLHSDLDTSKRVSFISALGGFGKLPDNPAFHDPRIELSYWSTRHEECFPGVARMRRTVVIVDRRYFIVRDTLQSLDGKEHDYQWIFNTFCDVGGTGPVAAVRPHTYYPRKIFLPDDPEPETRLLAEHALLEAGKLSMSSCRARLDISFHATGADAPESIGLWRAQEKTIIKPAGKNGSPEFGNITMLQFELHGKDVVMTYVMDARPQGCSAHIRGSRSVTEEGLDIQVLDIATSDGKDILVINESDSTFIYDGSAYRGISAIS